MLKVMLVDDETIITKGLMKLINWEEAGFVISGTADNAADAARLAERDRPDIIITDLHMPDVSGIDLIKSISETGLDVKLIVLSGYDEFEYAREAFRHGVVEYLLKPVTRQKLLEVLKKVSDMIVEERSFQDRLTLLKAQLHESMPLLKQKFLLDVLRDEVPDGDDIVRKAEFLDMDLTGSGYLVLALSIDNLGSNEIFSDKKDQVLLKFAAGNIAVETMGNKFRSYLAGSGDLLFILLVLDSDSLPVKEIFDAASAVKDNLSLHLKAATSIGISRLYTSIGSIGKAFNEANYALKFRYTLGQGGIIHINNFMAQQEYSREYPLEAEKKTIDAVVFDMSADPAELTAYLVKAFQEAAGNDLTTVYNYCIEFLVQLRRSLKGFGENPESILPYTIMAENPQNRGRTVSELYDWLHSILSDVTRYVSEKRKAREIDVIQEAKNYIDANFSEDLSLARVAGKVYMSPTYFSALFKSKTGENFSDYLTRIRMEYAARKLSDHSFKTYEIAGTFGYKNPRYFSEAFKKYYGMTPSEYKDKLGKK